MARWIIQISGLIIAVFAGMIFTIRLFAYDTAYYSALHEAFTAPIDCDSPCFLGVEPYVTTVDEAAHILQSHPWIAGIDILDQQMRRVAIDWTWTGAQPSLLNWYGGMTIRDDVVVSVTLDTDIPWGEFWLAFGRPQLGKLDFGQHIGVYTEYGFLIRTQPSCFDFWQQPVTVIITNTDLPYPPYNAMQHATCDLIAAR